MNALSQPAGRGMTVAEFLEYDDCTQTRYELVDGELVAINPPATRHVRLARTSAARWTDNSASLAWPTGPAWAQL